MQNTCRRSALLPVAAARLLFAGTVLVLALLLSALIHVFSGV